ncbi:hypothetical protein SBP18_05265 [Rhodoferax ferrireducens]|nr:hypothetical protein [Rhodoferax ferrireducens]WPC67923.1 hypothetical protein SBP18_05265 [Rhodoferax ferrireducens]
MPMYHEAVAAPARKFEVVISVVAKDKNGVDKWIELEVVFDDGRPTFDVLAKANCPAMKVHRQVGVQGKDAVN